MMCCVLNMLPTSSCDADLQSAAVKNQDGGVKIKAPTVLVISPIRA